MQEKLRSLFNALAYVETGHESDPCNALGDGGLSLGTYQIQYNFWYDATVDSPLHSEGYQKVRDKDYAEKVMILYWKKFCPEALEKEDYETLSRIHNAGLKGLKTPKADEYWGKVRSVLGNV